MKINSVTPTPASRVGDGGYATFVASATDDQLVAERNRHFGYTDPERVAQARVVCDEIARRAQ
ncbi:hypothetical protein PHELEMICH_82 [Mycobacterium phage Phelemich]|uniref:Uncharacterized protein n=2 Tax=Acadianvirus reprobate TaxID=1982903 RepID=S5Z936_9CAUD|nr:hypothetical protein N847_gp82 [Mycobacterium phage Phelemich]YP_008410005.1 hypothetical protein REPROBATE_84 [Mycobacterium phage Reprobate]AGT12820.1 hypothetical protein REPROBATE_84 [Mycobacterium phage Reprobate]AGT13996.1 hypothetical protein PHELEMICH_82 [Mycobacterium phage Phelemich]